MRCCTTPRGGGPRRALWSTASAIPRVSEAQRERDEVSKLCSACRQMYGVVSFDCGGVVELCLWCNGAGVSQRILSHLCPLGRCDGSVPMSACVPTKPQSHLSSTAPTPPSPTPQFPTVTYGTQPHSARATLVLHPVSPPAATLFYQTLKLYVYVCRPSAPPCSLQRSRGSSGLPGANAATSPAGRTAGGAARAGDAAAGARARAAAVAGAAAGLYRWVALLGVGSTYRCTQLPGYSWS